MPEFLLMKKIIVPQFPDMVDNLSALYQSMDARTRLVDRLSKLKGKLELMLSQVLLLVSLNKKPSLQHRDRRK